MDEAEIKKRQTAFKVSIKDMLNGKYVKDEGWQPNYVLVNNVRVSRVNLIAVVVEKKEEECFLDDGSGKISVRKFDNAPFNFEIGSVVLVIGKIREYFGNRYIIPEIIKNIENKKWIDVRIAELKLNEIDILDAPFHPNENYSGKIIEFLKEQDSKGGVDINVVVDFIGNDNTEEIISNLIKEGEIFEIRPGKLKILK